jgi:hypothetical protein
MTEFIQSTQYRRVVLGSHFDIIQGDVDCSSTDRVFCDRCKAEAREQAQDRSFHKASSRRIEGKEQVKQGQEQGDASGRQIIAGRLQELVEADELVFRVIDRLKRQCLFCELI